MQSVNPDSQLVSLVQRNDLEGVRAAVASGARVNAPRPSLENKTALHFAVARSGAAMVKLLLELGADPNARDSGGETPLSMAAFRGRADCVRELLAAKADVNARSKAGWTPLMAAASEGHAEVVRLLLKAGARPVSEALRLARKYGHAEVVSFLEESRR